MPSSALFAVVVGGNLAFNNSADKNESDLVLLQWTDGWAKSKRG